MIQIRQKTNKQKVLKGPHLPIVSTDYRVETLLAAAIANDQVPSRGRHFVSLNNNGAVMSHGSLD